MPLYAKYVTFNHTSVEAYPVSTALGQVYEVVIKGRIFVPAGQRPGNYSGAVILQTETGTWRVDMAVVVLAVDMRPDKIIMKEVTPPPPFLSTPKFRGHPIFRKQFGTLNRWPTIGRLGSAPNIGGNAEGGWGVGIRRWGGFSVSRKIRIYKFWRDKTRSIS